MSEGFGRKQHLSRLIQLPCCVREDCTLTDPFAKLLPVIIVNIGADLYNSTEVKE